MESIVGGGVRFGNPGGALVTGLLCAAFLLLIVLGWRQALRVSARHRMLSLGALRSATGVCGLLFALQPQCVGERVLPVKGRLAVLVDVSRSMAVREGQETRAQRAFELVEQWRKQGKPAFDLYTFGADARPVPGLDRAQLAREDDTRIQHALERVASDLGEELGAVVLLSDGHDQSPAFSPAQLKGLDMRVHTVGFTADAVAHDEAIVSAQADPVAFLRQSAQVVVTVRGQRGSRDPLTVSLRKDGQIVSEATAQLDAEGQGQVVLPFQASRVGRAVYSVSIPVAESDAVPENNERAVLVRVTRDKLRVLLLCGAPTWDTRFLRAFLKADPTIDLITFFILRTSSDLTMASAEELSLIPFPTDELFREHLDSFDIVIFQDFNYGPYQVAGYLPRIRDYVLKGGAFAMVGGSRSFGAGGYDRTPIAEILPAEMVPGPSSLSEHEFPPQVADDLARHPIIELVPDPAQNLKAWAELAPLLGANKLGGLKDGAQALLTHPTESGARGGAMPVLSVGEAGQGRSLALAADSSWRWSITTAGMRGDASAYERFWDRALRWLSRDPLLDPAHIETDRERYGPGAALKARMRLRDARYLPLADRALETVVLDMNGAVKRSQALQSDAEGSATAELQVPENPGAYRLAVREPSSSTVIAEQGFVVEAGGEELADPRARPDVMREIASTTGGTWKEATDSPKLDNFDTTRARALGTVVKAPFSSAPFFALLVLLFGAEWMIRRAWGLR